MRCQKVLLAVALITLTVAAQVASKPAEPAYLWVLDQNTGLGVPGASVAIGPGTACVGLTDPEIPNWTAHYVTNAVGRIPVRALPSRFSCRVERNGRVLEVVSATSFAAGPTTWTGPKWMALQHASEMALTVE